MTAHVVTVAQQKGGAGKTTLVAQLGAALAGDGRQVAVVDIDPQASLTGWVRLREHRASGAPALRFSMVGGWRLGVEIDRLKRETDLVLVDSPPHAETDARVAVRAADIVLVPVQPSPLDIWASAATLELAKKEKRRALIVLNRVPPRGHTVDDALAALADLGAEALVARLGNRQAYITSMSRGLGVVESEPRSTAAAEVRDLALEVLQRLG
jgi:chromosome partitioning protein